MEEKQIASTYIATDRGEIYQTKGIRQQIAGSLIHGYRRVTLTIEGAAAKFYVHKLIANAFIPNSDASKKKVIHLDYNKLNNKASNLKWATNEEAYLHQKAAQPDLAYSARKNKSH